MARTKQTVRMSICVPPPPPPEVAAAEEPPSKKPRLAPPQNVQQQQQPTAENEDKYALSEEEKAMFLFLEDSSMPPLEPAPTTIAEKKSITRTKTRGMLQTHLTVLCCWHNAHLACACFALCVASPKQPKKRRRTCRTCKETIAPAQLTVCTPCMDTYWMEEIEAQAADQQCSDKARASYQSVLADLSGTCHYCEQKLKGPEVTKCDACKLEAAEKKGEKKMQEERHASRLKVYEDKCGIVKAGIKAFVALSSEDSEDPKDPMKLLYLALDLVKEKMLLMINEAASSRGGAAPYLGSFGLDDVQGLMQSGAFHHKQSMSLKAHTNNPYSDVYPEGIRWGPCQDKKQCAQLGYEFVRYGTFKGRLVPQHADRAMSSASATATATPRDILSLGSTSRGGKPWKLSFKGQQYRVLFRYGRARLDNGAMPECAIEVCTLPK